jgi:hypothetical protein
MVIQLTSSIQLLQKDSIVSKVSSLGYKMELSMKLIKDQKTPIAAQQTLGFSESERLIRKMRAAYELCESW